MPRATKASHSKSKSRPTAARPASAPSANPDNASARNGQPSANGQQTGTDQTPQLRRMIVLACFLTSGATALAYEVVWVRMLTLIFGATVLSVGTVLASYMAGLALGSWYWSRRADATTRPLRLYALLEFGIAASALATPFLFHLLQGVYRSLFAEGFSDFSALSLVRFLLCLPALVLPTFLMGGTLPVLARFYTSSLARIGRGAGDLYAVNTFGAVLGTVLTGFFFIPWLGVQGTLFRTVALNVVVAALVYILSVRWARGADGQEVSLAAKSAADKAETADKAEVPAAAPVSESTPSHGVTGDTRRHIPLILFGFAVSGFAAMIFEVTWTRSLIQIFGNSTYAFTTMLACFLIGLALGAAVAGRFIDKARHPYFIFAMLQLIIGTWAATATPLIEWLPGLFLRGYERTGGSFASLQILQFLTCCLLMLPTTMSLGAVFPVVSKIFSARGDGAGRSVGLPYAVNTVGTVLGALSAGFLLLPRLGTELSMFVGVALNLLVCTAVLLTTRQMTLPPRLVAVLGALAVLACARLAFWRMDPRIVSAGVYMYPNYFLSMEQRQRSIRQTVEMKEVLYYREGYSTSVAVVRPSGSYIALQTNGKTDASTGDLSTQRALAHLPMLLKPKARDVLVVGLASGCTAGSTLLYPVQRVDCVEIEPAMVQAARFFDQWNYKCLDNERMRLHLQDARNYVLMSRQKYDVITAEPTNPWIAGVNNLFTQEYYRQCYSRLRDDGVMCQWLPAYNFSEDELRTALGTFATVFPHVTVWAFPRLRNDFFVIGSKKPLVVNPTALANRLRGAVRKDMEVVGVQDPWRLAGSLLFDEEATRVFCRGAQLNTDEHPLLEFSTPRHLYETESKIKAVKAAYAVGRNSSLTFPTARGLDALKLLGIRLPPQPGVAVTKAQMIPHHPQDLAPDNPLQDVAELRLELRTAQAAAVLQALPLPRQFWPESLTQVWASADAAPTAARREYTVPGAAAVVILDSTPAVSQQLGKLLRPVKPAR